MQNFDFHSDDLGATEEFLIGAYSPTRIRNDSPSRSSAQIRRDILGPISVDRLDLGFDMRYSTEPLDKVCLCAVRTGAIEDADGAGAGVFEPGSVGLLTPPDLPFAGVVRSASYSITMFDPALLDRVASAADQATPLRFAGHRPVDPAAGRRLAHVIDHIHNLAADPATAGSELAAAAAADYLAVTVLDTMPTTALLEPTATDRNDAHPDTVRRAVAYIETHLRDDISVADIAAAAYVTPRALQLAFRRHLDTTPLGYLRRLRLAAAHEKLAAADHGDGTTVTGVALEWGFAHPGRFAIAYRDRYGRAPRSTLRN
ncbi:AraC family transcriptional regulator [Nocardia shimofusensis]|uniref:AraC family transcriptional regulator n=1 Tax=Nocardia shimofusensis TaxID=228596 RepID=UPI00082D7715|nr:AraC family transcriptional regulator [Nocardia shimofusensis]